MGFLPTTVKEMRQLGWDYVDIVLFSGDAYIDHPSFGTAVVSRLFEDEGLRVAVVPQPNWRDDLRDFKKMGRPRLFFGISLDEPQKVHQATALLHYGTLSTYSSTALRTLHQTTTY